VDSRHVNIQAAFRSKLFVAMLALVLFDLFMDDPLVTIQLSSLSKLFVAMLTLKFFDASMDNLQVVF
jgi:hypothetical protein